MSNQHTHHDINNKGDLNISVDLKYHTLVDGLALGVVYLSKDLKVIDKNHLTNGREVSLLLAYLAHEVRAQAGDESVAFN